MPLHTVIAHDPALLLERAADGFLDLRRGDPSAPFPTPSYLLALRQGGLRDDLLRLAARRGCPGWFDPPLCVFGELPARLGGTARLPLAAAERLVLLGRVLQEGGGEVFSHARRPDDYLEALDALFGELCAEGVEPGAFAESLERAGGDGRDDFELRRDAELAAAYAGYRAALDRDGRRDGRDDLVDAARAVVADPDGLAQRLGGRREVRIVGLQDLRGGWRPLLAALAASPALDRVVLHTSVELGLGLDGATVEDLRGQDGLAARLFGDGRGERLPRTVHGVAAPAAARGVEEVARRVRALLDAGVAPHRVAVVAREARPHVDLAAGALARMGVPVTARQRVALLEIPAVRAVLTLLDAAAGGWTRHALVEVAEQPYLDAEIDVQVLNTVGYRRRVRGLGAWRTALEELQEEAAQRERGEEPESDAWERRTRLPVALRVDEARAALAHLASRARELDAERTLAAWHEWLRRVVDEDAWGIERRLHRLPAAGRVDVARADIAGWRGLREAAAGWRIALERFGGGDERMGAGGFAQRLRRMLGGDVALWTDTAHGVQLLEGPAAAYRAFDHLFVVGLESGGFPSRAPRSPVLGDRERERLVEVGLPLDPPDAWDRRERELFRVLVAGAPHGLTLAWSQVDGSGREVVRSAFVDEVEEAAALQVDEIPLSRVLTAGMPLCADREAAGHAGRVAAIERARQEGAPSPWNGAVDDPSLRRWIAHEFGEDRVWSPTQLEHYARCAWAYFAERLLRIEAREEPDDGIEPSVRGRILHRALERFYDLARRERGGAPVLLGEDDGPRAARQVERELDETIGEFERDGTWLGATALRVALRDELARILRRYVEFEIEHVRLMHSNRSNKRFILRTGVESHEVRFDDVALDLDGVRVRFRGSIDRVERGVDDRVDGAGRFIAAVDYKTSTGAIPGGGKKEAWDDDVVLQVPIYARVLEELYPGDSVSRIEYRSLRGRKVEHQLQLYQVSKLPALEQNEDDNERMVNAMRAISRHVADARGGRFPANPKPSCGCPSYCPAIDVCRVPGGPRTREW